VAISSGKDDINVDKDCKAFFEDFHLTFHIVKLEWLHECIAAKMLVPFKSEHILYAPMNTMQYFFDYCARKGRDTFVHHLEFSQPMCSFLREHMEAQEKMWPGRKSEHGTFRAHK